MPFLKGRNRDHQGKEATVVKSRRTLSLPALSLLLALSGSLQAQVRLSVPCSVRIRPAAAADYDLASEVNLRGILVGREGR